MPIKTLKEITAALVASQMSLRLEYGPFKPEVQFSAAVYQRMLP